MQALLFLAGLALLAPGHARGPNDTIALQGPSSVPGGSQATFQFSAAPFQADWWMGWSPNLGGTVVKGHSLDIGPGIQVFASGNTGFIGTGSAMVNIPAKASGRTVHIEVLAVAGGQFFDSNALTVRIT